MQGFVHVGSSSYANISFRSICILPFFHCRDSLHWPKSWNLDSTSKHGFKEFSKTGPNGTETTDPIIHRRPTEIILSEYTHSTTFGTLNKPVDIPFNIARPSTCALNVREDTRCDVARSVLFGESASVGQICSIADAVTLDPNNMPGTCCLDTTRTLENFGEQVSSSLRSFFHYSHQGP